MINEPSNQGEGNPEAAERFNKAEREFVNSDRGKQKIQKGAQVRPEEEADLAKAEQRGRERAKEDDTDASAGRMKDR
ncbi:MAG TPA: hypothetical protein VHS07_01005 [Candidatus Binataceae bacterium]|jgi:hypothetical protein|nr:hypothetical protein [Candidatus Binataceae bacterium]